MILIALQDQEAFNWQNIICRIVPVVHDTHIQRYRYQVNNINTNMQLSTFLLSLGNIQLNTSE